MPITTKKPIDMNQQKWIVKRLTLNWTYDRICEEFAKNFDRTISKVTLKRLKDKYAPSIHQGQAMIADQGIIQATTLQQQSYRLLTRKMANAEEDFSELEKLRRDWLAGRIDDKEYKRKRTLYEELTVSELTKIADTAQNHLKKGEEAPASPADRAALEVLLQGIKAGNPVQLVQILNPTASTSESSSASPL